MSTFTKYIFLNVALIFFHIIMFFAGVMGFGGAAGNESRSEILKALLFFAFIGTSPNLLVLLIAFIKKKNLKAHLVSASVFTIIVFAAYFIVFRSVLK